MKTKAIKTHQSAEFKKRLGLVGVGLSFFAFAFLVVSMLSPIVITSATTNTANVQSTDGKETASIAVDDIVEIEMDPGSSQETFTGTQEITLSSSCPNGTTLVVSPYDNDTRLISNSLASNKRYISTTKSVDGTLDDDSWGFSLDDGDNYYGISRDGSDLLGDRSLTGNNDSISVTYGIRVDNSYPASVYEKELLYTLSIASECTFYEITFDTNGGTPIESTLGLFGQTFDLSNYTTTKENYELTGWTVGDEFFDTDETEADINPDNLDSVTIVAVWSPVGGGDNPDDPPSPTSTTFSGITTMQQMTSEICEEETIPSVSATETTLIHSSDTSKAPRAVLTDTRDGNTYTITKLADGNCWMTNQTLKIAGKTLTSSDSDVTDSFALPATADAWTETRDLPVIMDSGNSDYGYYYNFAALSAGTVTGSTTTYTQAPATICPKGWTVPLRDDWITFLNTYSVLDVEGGGITLASAPINFPLAGRFFNGQAESQGVSAEIWSRDTVRNSRWGWGLHFSNSETTTSSANLSLDRREARSILCVAK